MNEFRKENGKIVLNVPYAEAYLPASLVSSDPLVEKTIGKSNSTVAILYGEGFQTLGLFNMRFYKSDSEDRESAKLRTLNYPNTIITLPSNYYRETLKLTPDAEEEKYYVLQYYQGDIIMDSSIPKRSSNCEDFLDILVSGKIPYGISIWDLYFAWKRNFDSNGVDPDVPGVTLQMMISDLARLRDDPSEQFRRQLGKGGVDPTNYRVYNMVNIAANNSVLTALSFQRFGYMLTTSLNMTKSGKAQVKSPLEEVLSY